MRFIAEYYFKMMQSILVEVIEAEDLQSASEKAKNKENEYRVLVNVCEE